MCLWAWRYKNQKGSYPSANFFRAYPQLRPRGGEFDKEFMEYVLTLGDLMARWAEDRKTRSHRVRLDSIMIAIMAFFTRFAEVQVRHRHLLSPVANLKKAVTGLSKKLENQRRRALRKTKAEGRGPLYSGLAERWHQFHLWMRGNLLYCGCGRTSMASSRRLQRLYVADCERVAKKVIQEQELRMPDQKELRELVRSAIRYSRRGRLGVGVRTLIKGDDTSFFIWSRFLNKRLRPLREVN